MKRSIPMFAMMLLITCGSGRSAEQRNLSTEEVPQCTHASGRYGRTYVSADGERIATVRGTDVLMLGKDCSVIWSLPFQPASSVERFHASRDLERLLLIYHERLGKERILLISGSGSILRTMDIEDPILSSGTAADYDSSFEFIDWGFISPGGLHIAFASSVPMDPDYKMALYDATLQPIWVGKPCTHPDTLSISTTNQYVTCNLSIYNPAGEKLFQPALPYTEYNPDPPANPGVVPVYAAFAGDESTVAFSYVSYDRATLTSLFSLELWTTGGQKLWNRNVDAFEIDLSTDGSRVFAKGPDGVLAYDRQGNLLWSFRPAYEASSVHDDQMAVASDGSIVAAVLRPMREPVGSGDLVSGLSSVTADFYVLSGTDGSVILHQNLGDVGIPKVGLSADGRTFVAAGTTGIRILDLSQLILGFGGGNKPGGTGGSK